MVSNDTLELFTQPFDPLRMRESCSITWSLLTYFPNSRIVIYLIISLVSKSPGKRGGLWIADFISLLGEGFYWFPSARPFVLRGSKIATFFLDRRFCEQHLSEREVLWTAWVYGRTRAQPWGAVERGVSSYVLCTSKHQHMEPTVVCAEFVTLIVVLRFMPKCSHFAGKYTTYIHIYIYI